jgi:hypothetical protein
MAHESEKSSSNSLLGVGVVVIGRNEGERFRRCVQSLVGGGSMVVYVDSGSSDGSQTFARAAGVEVVDLDMSTPFTAARARNAGLARLVELLPDVEFVQFVDGDCEVHGGWPAAAANALRQEEKLAAVSGRLRERFPEKSLYNRLADLEWDRPVGIEKSCGGNAMFRVRMLREVGGYDATLIAGEEPELCARLRAKGWLIRRIANEMALHDLAMFKQSQWLTRARRHGFAMLEVSRFKTQASHGLFQQQMRSAVIWGLVVPGVMWVFVVSFAVQQALTWTALLLVFGGRPDMNYAAYVDESLVTKLEFLAHITRMLSVPATLLALVTIGQWLRLASRARREKGLSWREALLYSRLLLASKASNVRGMWQMLRRRWNKARATLIDYKTQESGK